MRAVEQALQVVLRSRVLNFRRAAHRLASRLNSVPSCVRLIAGVHLGALLLAILARSFGPHAPRLVLVATYSAID